MVVGSRGPWWKSHDCGENYGVGWGANLLRRQRVLSTLFSLFLRVPRFEDGGKGAAVTRVFWQSSSVVLCGSSAPGQEAETGGLAWIWWFLIIGGLTCSRSCVREQNCRDLGV